MHWHHWLYDDFYVPIWPNIIASIIMAIWVYGRLKALERLHKKHHAEMKRWLKMPYKIEADGENYKVINEDTGEVKAVHEPPDAKDKAERQVRLLHAIEHNADFEPKE